MAEQATPSKWHVDSPYSYMSENPNSKMLINPDPSKNTIYVKLNEGQYEDWTNCLEWIWTSKVRAGAFVIIIASHRGCFIRHEGKFVDNPKLDPEQERDYERWLENDIRQVVTFKREELTHDGRLFVLAPVPKPEDGYGSERAANDFAQKIAKSVGSMTKLQAEIVMYDSDTAKFAIDHEPEYASVEVNFNSEKHKLPQVYINGGAY
jgi:hypothetical protein